MVLDFRVNAVIKIQILMLLAKILEMAEIVKCVLITSW